MRHRQIDAFRQDLDIDEHVEAALRVPVPLKDVVVVDTLAVPGVWTPTRNVGSVDASLKARSERVSQPTRALDIGREDKGLAVLLPVVQVLLHDRHIAPFVATKTCKHSGRRFVKIPKMRAVGV